MRNERATGMDLLKHVEAFLIATPGVVETKIDVENAAVVYQNTDGDIYRIEMAVSEYVPPIKIGVWPR